MPQWIYLLPLVTAFIGWAIHFLSGNYFLNSYLPKKDQMMAESAGKIAAAYVSNSLRLEEKITNPDLIEKAMPAIEKHIDEFLNVKLATEIPMLAMFVGNKTTDKIKEVFISQLRILFPQVMLQLTGNLKNDLNIEKIVADKLKLTPVSALAKEHASGQLRQLRLLGLCSGLICGLVSLLMVVLAFN